MARDIAGKKKPLNHPLAFLQNQKWNDFQSISGTSSAKRLVIKPIYRHSPCDRRGRGRTKKRRRGPGLRTVFVVVVVSPFFFFLQIVHHFPIYSIMSTVNTRPIFASISSPFFLSSPTGLFNTLHAGKTVVKLQQPFFFVLSDHSKFTLESFRTNMITGLPFSFN